MSTAMMTAFLTGVLLAGESTTPTWQTNYSQAQEQSADQKKPLAIVFGAGPGAWTKVVRDAAPTADAGRLLTDKYICVYVDTASPAGRTLADSFKMGNLGLVLSDRTGQVQAFRCQGDMTNDNLVRCLQKYSDANMTVTSTENPNATRTSFYPSENTTSTSTTFDGAGYWGGATFGGSTYGGSTFGGGGSSYCPSCSGGGGGGRRR